MRKIAPQWFRDILTALYQRRTVSRANIIEIAGLNPGSVSQALKHLLKRNIVRKVGETESNGGRKAELLQLNPRTAYFIAVDLGGTRARFALMDFAGDMRRLWEQELPAGKNLAVSRIAEGIRIVSEELAPAERARLQAVGISYPGYGDRGWNEFPLEKNLAKTVSLPIYLERDDFASVMAERWIGRGQSSDHWIHLETGSGVGFGIFAEGRQIRGWRKVAGELGHIVVDSSAPDLCNCGRRGCLEAIVASPNLVRQYFERIGTPAPKSGYPASEIFCLARRGDADAAAVLGRAGRVLGVALSYAVNLVNPELIIISGDIAEAEDLIVPIMQSEMALRNLPESLSGLRIVASALGADVRLRGAACLAFSHTIADPAKLLGICSDEAPVPAGERKASARRRTVSVPA